MCACVAASSQLQLTQQQILEFMNDAKGCALTQLMLHRLPLDVTLSPDTWHTIPLAGVPSYHVMRLMHDPVLLPNGEIFPASINLILYYYACVIFKN